MFEHIWGSKFSSAGVRLHAIKFKYLFWFWAFRVHPRKTFSGALYRAEHHTPMGRVLRSYALEPSRGLCGSDT